MIVVNIVTVDEARPVSSVSVDVDWRLLGVRELEAAAAGELEKPDIWVAELAAVSRLGIAEETELEAAADWALGTADANELEAAADGAPALADAAIPRSVGTCIAEDPAAVATDVV